MRYFLLFFALIPLFTMSCLTQTTTIVDNDAGKTVTNTIEQPKQSLKGSLKSVEGVMDQLSCYCGAGAYLFTNNDGQYSLCFDKFGAIPECKNVKVTGSWTTKSIDPEDTSPCPAGTRKYMMVETCQCED